MSDAGRAAVDALRQAAAIGPFFALEIDPTGPGWTAFADFVVDRVAVAAAVAQARTKLAEAALSDDALIEWRVAASVWHLGLVARLVAPALGAAAVAGWSVHLGRMLWLPASESTTLAIGVGGLTGTRVTGPADAAQAILDGVIRPLVEPLTTTVAAVGSVSDQVLWGNVWSAVAGAAIVVANGREVSGTAAVAIARSVVESTDRPMAGSYLPSGRYRRDTCCLYYRLPRAGLCGDCVLHQVPPSRAGGT